VVDLKKKLSMPFKSIDEVHKPGKSSTLLVNIGEVGFILG